VIDEIPSSMVALRGAMSALAAVFCLAMGAFFMSFGDKVPVIVGLAVALTGLVLAGATFVWLLGSRRATITVDDRGLVVHYARFRRDIKAPRESITGVQAYPLPSVPPFGTAYWLSHSGRGALFPVIVGVGPLGGGESSFLPWARLCGVGTQGMVVVTMTSGRWPLGIMTDHAGEVAAALEALLRPPPHPAAASPTAPAVSVWPSA
jgi:hypothetical protein